jgi:hypothetical protein
MTVRQAESYVDRILRDKPVGTENPQKKDEVNYISEAERRLSLAIDRGVKISVSKKGGKITIAYYDDDDFNALYDELKSIKKRRGRK